MYLDLTSISEKNRIKQLLKDLGPSTQDQVPKRSTFLQKMFPTSYGFS